MCCVRLYALLIRFLNNNAQALSRGGCSDGDRRVATQTVYREATIGHLGVAGPPAPPPPAHYNPCGVEGVVTDRLRLTRWRHDHLDLRCSCCCCCYQVLCSATLFPGLLRTTTTPSMYNDNFSHSRSPLRLGRGHRPCLRSQWPDNL